MLLFTLLVYLLCKLTWVFQWDVFAYEFRFLFQGNRNCYWSISDNLLTRTAIVCWFYYVNRIGEISPLPYHKYCYQNDSKKNCDCRAEQFAFLLNVVLRIIKLKWRLQSDSLIIYVSCVQNGKQEKFFMVH